METTDDHCDRSTPNAPAPDAPNAPAGTTAPNTPSDPAEPATPGAGLTLSDEDFDALVEAQVAALPEPMLAELDNVAIFVEDIDPVAGMELLGVYEGVDAPSRGEYGFGELPDRIVLFKLPLLAISRSMEELRHQIHVTLVHEIAHFYGLDDDELHRLGWA